MLLLFAGFFADDERTAVRPVQVAEIRQQLENFIREENLSFEDRDRIMSILYLRDFIGTDIDGNRINYSNPEYRGYSPADIVIFGYYAEWCPNCHRNLPALLRLYDQHRTQGLQVVLSFMYSNPERVEKYVRNENIPFPVLIGSQDREENPEVRLETTHYILRTILDDYRRWGTPFYIIYVKNQPDTWYVVAGEFIEEEIEKFLSSHLN